MKKGWNIGLCLLCVMIFLTLGLVGCNNGNNGKSVKNAEFEEYKEIVTSVNESIVGIREKSVQAVSAKTNALSLRNTALTSDATDIFDELNAVTPKELSDVSSFYEDVVQQTIYIPLICGDAITKFHKASQFYGVNIGLTEWDQYLKTESNGTKKESYIYTAATAPREATYLSVGIDYKSKSDFEIKAYQFNADFTDALYLYANSQNDFLAIRNTPEQLIGYDEKTGEEIYAGDLSIEYAQQGGQGYYITDQKVVTSYFERVKPEFLAIDQTKIREIAEHPQYTLTSDQFYECNEKYFPSAPLADYDIRDGVFFGWVGGDDKCPETLTIPSEATAIVFNLYLPDRVKKLVIPSTVTAVKIYDYRLEELENPNTEKPDPSRDEVVIVDCPLKYFEIHQNNPALEEISAPDSTIFQIENHCLYSKDGNLLFIPNSPLITSLTLDASTLSDNIRRNLSSLSLPNLKNVDVTIAYEKEQSGGRQQIECDPFDLLMQPDYDKDKDEAVYPSYAFDKVVIRGIRDVIVDEHYNEDYILELPQTVSIGRLELFGEGGVTVQTIFSSGVEIAKITEIAAKEGITGLSADVSSATGLRVEVSSTMTQLRIANRADGESYRTDIVLPWSKYDIIRYRLYSLLRVSEETYAPDYETTVWGDDKGFFTYHFVELSQEDRADIEAELVAGDVFKNISYHSNGNEHTASITNYYGSDSVVRVPSALKGYTVTRFELNNIESGAALGEISVSCIRELYLPKTLTFFELRNFDGYPQYSIEKIVYAGTKKEFETVCAGDDAVARLLETVSLIECADGAFGAAPVEYARAIYRYRNADGITITIRADWDTGDSLIEVQCGDTKYDSHTGGEIYGYVNFEKDKVFYNIRIQPLQPEFHTLDVFYLYFDGEKEVKSSFDLVSVEEYAGEIEVEHRFEEKTIDPGCEYGGFTNHRCTICGYDYNDHETPALGHKYEVTVHEANCTNGGYTEYRCSRCENSYRDNETPALEHDYTNTRVEATCQSSGYIRHECSRCGQWYDESLGSELGPHQYEITSSRDADCTHDGYRSYRCRVCGTSYNETLPALGHGDFTYENIVAPTCTEDGYRERICGRCHETIRDQIVEALGHAYGDDGMCTACLSVSKYFSFELREDGYYVTGLLDRTLKNPVLNASVNGTPVVGICPYAFNYCNFDSFTVPKSVMKIENYAFADCGNLKNITLAEGSALTSIGVGAFYECSGLTSIVIPNSVTIIGESAFSGCSGLTSITLPFVGENANGTGNISFGYIFNGVPSSLKTVMITGGTSIGVGAFSGCSGLTSIVIPNSVTIIGFDAFYGCSGLTSIVIPNSVTSIGARAFEGCSGLTSMTLPFVPSFGYIFRSVPSSLKTVMITGGTSTGESVFEGCSGLTSIVIPDSVTSIGGSAFSGCSGLTSIVIPDSVTSIGGSAFSGCSGLTSIVIPNNVTSIGERAFYGCSGLTSIVIPDSVTSIGGSAFSGCSGLTSITVTEGNSKYHSAGNCIIETSTKELILGCKTSAIPTDGSVTSIGESAFYGCSGLTSITIPDRVMSIGAWAFYGCSGLTSIVIPNSVTSIDDFAFEGCSGLTSIVIPASVTSIGGDAFRGCDGLTNIIVDENNTTYKSLDGNLYSKDGKTLIYYAKGKVDAIFNIPNGVTSIDSNAFYECDQITSITIPNSVTSIWGSPFDGSYGLTDIIFNGTKAQWNAISKAWNWNDNTGDYTITCTDGTISKYQS